MIILVCWAHHLIYVGDVLHVTDPMIQVVKIALEIITWFNSHAYALCLCKLRQIITYNKSRAIFLPVLTCWLVHYDTTVCLLKLRPQSRLAMFGTKKHLIARAGDATKQEMAARVSL